MKVPATVAARRAGESFSGVSNLSRSASSRPVFVSTGAPFTAEPGGIGYELPPWLEALEQAVEQSPMESPEDERSAPIAPSVPQVKLPLAELRRQIDSWDHG